jgi:hypothetical protein
MARRAKKAGARFFAAQPLFLKPCSKPVFMRFIQKHFPELEKIYATRYGDNAFVSRAYSERIAALVRAVIARYGLDRRFSEDLHPDTETVWPIQEELWPVAKKPPQRA